MSIKKACKTDVLYNTKIKKYRDGSTTITRCNNYIFKKAGFEYHTKNENEIDKLHHSIFLQSTSFQRMYFEDSFGFIDMRDFSEKREVQKRNNTDIRDDSLKRAKDKIFDIIFQNDWKYFVTVTFNGSDFSRDDIPTIIKKLQKFLNNAVSRKKLRYVLVPELHKKGGVHCHLLINDCDFTFCDSFTRLVKGYDKPLKLDTIKRLKLCEKLGCDVSSLRTVYNISDWKYGYSTAIETYGSPSNLAYYVTKYITKDVKRIFGKFYWSSKNLVRSADIEYENSSFNDNLPVISPARANLQYQYESDFKYTQTEKNCNDILQILKENGLD